MTDDRRRAEAADGHGRAVSSFVEAMAAVPAAAWHMARAAGKCSPAALALHVCQAYAFDGLQRAAREQPTLRMIHAYFGPMPPLQTSDLLSAHTRHHPRGLTVAHRS
jgi:hypothetical protein